MAICVIEVIILPGVGDRPDMGRRKHERFIETTILRPIGIVVAEVPFTELPRDIAGLLQQLRHSRHFTAEQGSTTADVHGSVAYRIATGHQLAARGRTHRRDVKIDEPNTLVMKAIDMRCLDDRVTMAREVTVSMVVGDYNDDVRTLRQASIDDAKVDIPTTSKGIHMRDDMKAIPVRGNALG